MDAKASRESIDLAVSELLGVQASEDVAQVPGLLAYLAESIETELGEGWLYDLETIIRERRERGRW